MLFKLGQTVATPGALAALTSSGESATDFLFRHASGDWGDLDNEDKESNDRGVEFGERIFSAYHLKDGVKIWVITEADRSSTTILLPEEY